VVTGSVAGVGAILAAQPLAVQAQPAGRAIAPRVIVDIAPIRPGQEITITWDNQPVIIRNRTAAEIESVRDTPLDTLRDPLARNAARPTQATASDANRTLASHPQWLVVIGICPHLGCKVIGAPLEGEQGWYCPCHAARFDLSGRLQSGPATTNLAVPPFRILARNKLEIGQV